MKGDRIRMNFLAISGDDVLDTDPFNWPSNQDDEMMLILNLPHNLGRRKFRPTLFYRSLNMGAYTFGFLIGILIEGTALAAHFSYTDQDGVITTDLLDIDLWQRKRCAYNHCRFDYLQSEEFTWLIQNKIIQMRPYQTQGIRSRICSQEQSYIESYYQLVALHGQRFCHMLTAP